MMTRRAPAPRGFTLLEVLIASTVSLTVITLALMVGVQLQRRGQMEERTTETQNAARAARDLVAASIQRAGVAVGSRAFAVGNDGAGEVDLRYAVWPRTGAGASDAGMPQGDYENLVSDVLDIWETDPGIMIPLIQCSGGGGNQPPWEGNHLCTDGPIPPALEGRFAAVVAVGMEPEFRFPACVGRLGNVGDSSGTATVGWAPGVPGRAPPASHPCGEYPATPGNTLWAPSNKLFLIPVTARTYRVNWRDNVPVLEMDPDGAMGEQGFSAVSRDIERLQVRLGVMPSDEVDEGVLYFPDPAANRPAMDQCTHDVCSPFVTWDAGAGVTLAGDQGPGSARDELMKRVRLVELLITARSQRVDLPAQGLPPGEQDEDGNVNDGFKRRHSVIRVAPRNFGF